MKILNLLFTFLLAGFLLLFVGQNGYCQSSNTQREKHLITRGERPVINLKNVPIDAYIQGVIRIKLKSNYAGEINPFQLQKDTKGQVVLGLPAVDALNKTLSVNKIKPLFFPLGEQQQKFSAKHQSWGFHLWYTLELDKSTDIIAAVEAYSKLKEIEFAEPEYKKHHITGLEKSVLENSRPTDGRPTDGRPTDDGQHRNWMPNDPGFGEQWHYHNTGQESGTPDADIDLPEAWDLSKGNPNVIVAIIDGGIDYTHMDIAPNMWEGIGYNFVNNSPNVTADKHGTHVAGTVAASSGNGIGVAGIAGGSGSGDGVRLMSLQIFMGEDQGGSHSALVWAADNGAAITQNSWGHNTPDVYNQSDLSAIDYFNQTGGGNALTGGGITIFAAGNDDSSGNYYPGCYSGTLSVAATNNRDERSYYSNYDTWVDISAPGGETYIGYVEEGILSTLPGNSYGFLQGTSMACPHVSGVAALIASMAYGQISNTEVRNILLSSTDNIDAANLNYLGKLGSGRLNAHNALIMTQDLLGATPNPKNFTAFAQSANEVLLSWILNQDNNNVVLATSLDGTFGTPNEGDNYQSGDELTGGGSILFSGNATTFSHLNLFGNTTYFYKLWSVDNAFVYSSGVNSSVTTSNPCAGFEDNFEGHTNFATTFAPWTNVDVDGSGTYGITDYSWLNAGTRQSFIVFNPSATTPALGGATAHSGNKFAACFAADDPPNNDWLISPRVTIGAGTTVNFWAKSYTVNYGLERFKVGISTTLNPDDFTFITPIGSYVEAPTKWTEYSYDLSAYADQNLYVGIQCVSHDAMFLMVDDFSIATPCFTISTQAGQNGTISPSGNIVINQGDNQTFNIVPNSKYNYIIADVVVDGVSVGAVSEYTFTNTTANHTIEATFEFDQTDATQLSWQIANPRIIKISELQRLEFDVQVKANENGTYYSSGQFMINFNNDAFPYSSDTDWTAIAEGISAQTHPDIGNKYTITKTLSGSYPDVKISLGLNPSNLAADNLAEITTEWQTYVKLQGQITDANSLADIYFDEAGTNNQNFQLTTADNESAYFNPSLYEALHLQDAYLGRLYSNKFGWTQHGGTMNHVPYLDWTTSVNTSVWDGNALINGSEYQAKNLRIHDGASLSVQSNASLTINEALSNESGIEGLKILSSAAGTGSLIHATDNVSANIQRHLAGNSDLLQLAYHLVSIPIMEGAISGWFMGSYLYRFDAPSQDWAAMGTSTSTPLPTDQGYMIYYPEASTTYTFQGSLFNGNIPLSVDYETVGTNSGMNLVPNPYPSAIDWNSEAGWTKTNIMDAIWIWNPEYKNYSTFGTGIGTLNATQYIPTGQSFFVKANAANPIFSVNNTARVHNTQAFYKMGDPNNILRVKATANGYQDELIVRIDENASVNYDPSEDVDKMFGNEDAPQFYSTSNDQQTLSINSLNLPSEGITIPLSFELKMEGKAQLLFENIPFFANSLDLILEDLVTATFIDLKDEATYLFSHSSQNTPQRFLLHIADPSTKPGNTTDNDRIWVFNNKVYISIPSSIGEQALVKVSDLQGRTILEEQVTLTNMNCISIPNFSGIVLVSVTAQKKNHIVKALITK